LYIGGVGVHNFLEVRAEPGLGVSKVIRCEFDECGEFGIWVSIIAEGQCMAFVGVLGTKSYAKSLDAMENNHLVMGFYDGQ